MRVNVFTKGAEPTLEHDLLVLPDIEKAAIPDAFDDDWTYFATVDTEDEIFGQVEAPAIEAELSASGYALVRTARP